ncbi:hypothetical protein JET18_16600 [Chryseobacterium sp. L7]|uniref:DUF4251 domain-containing protein n=1 Tax=Chryseobacterium endalhagicum TaxID=2797638 RepID=A0ABS1QIM9_9FLAO|nr:hypothetical protein [Chryseobacterium endalhagicum]MBL1222475.1 hypothetical protein [Chryseobacterium endalhagicum]
MRIKLTMMFVMLFTTAMAQKQINLTPEIEVTLSKGLNIFDDKENTESINKMVRSGIPPEPYRLLVTDFAYKKGNIIVRFFVGKSEWPTDYNEDKRPKYNKLNTRHVKDTSFLILDYQIGKKSYHKIEVKNTKSKDVVTIEIEYNAFVNGEKQRAGDLMKELLEGFRFR